MNSFKWIVQLWDLKTGECLRSLDHEKQIRSVAIDGHRLLTGDMEGYVFAWDLENVCNPEVGSDRLCMRAHNAMDPVVFDRNTEKPVYGVHLEQAAMIQVKPLVANTSTCSEKFKHKHKSRWRDAQGVWLSTTSGNTTLTTPLVSRLT